MIPHEVWIDQTGKVFATTDAEAVNEKNVELAINGKKPAMRLKVDQVDFDRNKPLFVHGNGGSRSAMRVRSVFAEHIDGIISGAGNTIDSINSLKRIYFLNLPPIDLYLSAVQMQFSNRVIIEVEDSSRLIPDTENRNDWYAKNTYCYEITFPLEWSEKLVCQKWLTDLNCGLNLNGRLEKRKMDCWVISRKSNNDTSLYSHTTKSLFTEIKDILGVSKEQQIYTFRNKPMHFVMQMLNDKDQPIILDETGIENGIDIDLPVIDLHDVNALKLDFSRYGL